MDITVVPAYGRDYTSGAAVRQAWEDGMDFQIVGIHPDRGRYLSIRDADEFDKVTRGARRQVWVRYSNLTKKIKVHG